MAMIGTRNFFLWKLHRKTVKSDSKGQSSGFLTEERSHGG